jgi:CRP-like cAMP-binding protein
VQPRQQLVPAAPAPLSPQTLKLLPWLSELNNQQRDRLLANARAQRHPRQASIVAQDTPSDTVMVVLRGRAHAERMGSNGRLVLLDVLRPSDCIGLLSLLDRVPHSASVRCVQPTEVLALPAEDFHDCLRHAPALCQALVQDLVRRQRSSNRRIGLLALHTVQERVMATLQDNASPDPNGHWVVDANMTRQELARLVGASREMVSRVLQSLHAEGRVRLRLGNKRALVLPCPPTR